MTIKTTIEWNAVADKLPERSDFYVCAMAHEDGRIYNITYLNYSAKHKCFNAFDSDSKREAKWNCLHPLLWAEVPTILKAE